MKRIIVNLILRQLERRSPLRTADDREKIHYILSVLISELGKVLFLLTVFILLNAWKEYLFSLLVILITRSFAGGPHEKNSLLCLLHTFVFFLIVIFIAKEGFPITNMIVGVISITYCFFSPIVSGKRGTINHRKYKKLKMLSVIGVVTSGVLAVCVQQLRDVILATLLVEWIEFMILLGIRRWKNVGEVK